MSLDSKERQILEFLSQKADHGKEGLLTTAHVCGQLDIRDKEEAEEICNRLRKVGWLGPELDPIHCHITAAGVEQLKPCWRRHIVLIVAVATFIVAAVAALFTILVYLRGGE